jgi:glyoxylase-like metal-dependent hydrolase (beta-lactamase superfamily II)
MGEFYLNSKVEIIQKGDENGNGMTVRFRLSSGLEIIGLATKNHYGGHWDLGPTWNYVVMTDKPFLVDSGRFGQGKNLVGMMTSAGVNIEALDFVLISHGHEDHDGGLAELVGSTHLSVKAHVIYKLLIQTNPTKAPHGHKQNFPAKCWHCPMPESFFAENCLEYHAVIQKIEVNTIGDGENDIMPDVRAYHLPGHSPDCLAVLLGDQAIIVGDIVLPGISPWPTREALFEEVAAVIGPYYTEPETIFGLRRYIKSLKKLIKIARKQPQLLMLPAHRLYYQGQWNDIDLEERINELLQHHLQRCTAVLEILHDKPKSVETIAEKHFEERLLKGYGSIMAANEIVSHCELLIACGDLIALDDNTYAATGTNNFEEYIHALEPDNNVLSNSKAKYRRILNRAN